MILSLSEYEPALEPCAASLTAAVAENSPLLSATRHSRDANPLLRSGGPKRLMGKEDKTT
jgi:hypothetical protein